jgi:hypothetical protein
MLVGPMGLKDLRFMEPTQLSWKHKEEKQLSGP